MILQFGMRLSVVEATHGSPTVGDAIPAVADAARPSSRSGGEPRLVPRATLRPVPVPVPIDVRAAGRSTFAQRADRRSRSGHCADGRAGIAFEEAAIGPLMRARTASRSIFSLFVALLVIGGAQLG